LCLFAATTIHFRRTRRSASNNARSDARKALVLFAETRVRETLLLLRKPESA
jgi:hypothetical protein